MFAAYRLARSSPQQAANHWSGLEAKFTEEERAFVWGNIGLQGALRHDPQTLSWYAKAGDMNDYQLEWKARAALARRRLENDDRRRRCDGERKSGFTMALLESACAQGHRARCRGIGAVEAAVAGIFVLSATGAGRTGRQGVGAPRGYTPTAAEVQAMSQNAGIRRALALYALGMRGEATREWAWSIRSFDDRQLLAAAEVAKRADLPDRVINTADKTQAVHDFRLRYFAPYHDVLKVHAARQGLDEAWVLGLIRQESRFIVDIRSSAAPWG
jgi:soluble lytic murein transglycosylase